MYSSIGYRLYNDTRSHQSSQTFVENGAATSRTQQNLSIQFTLLSPINSDTAQLNWTSSWVELCRYKWGLTPNGKQLRLIQNTRKDPDRQPDTIWSVSCCGSRQTIANISSKSAHNFCSYPAWYNQPDENNQTFWNSENTEVRKYEKSSATSIIILSWICWTIKSFNELYIILI